MVLKIYLVELSYPKNIFYVIEVKKLNEIDDIEYKNRVDVLESLLKKENILVLKNALNVEVASSLF